MSFEHLDDRQPFRPDEDFRAAALGEGRRRRRRRLSLAAGAATAVAAVVVALLVVAVPGSDPARVDTPPTEPPTSTAPPEPTPTTETEATTTTAPDAVTPTVAPTTTTAPPTTVTTAPPIVVERASGYSFDAPSHNIGCVVATGPGEQVRCDVLMYTYEPPPSAQPCPVDYGYTLRLAAGEPGYFGCSGDYVGGVGPVLEYGTGVRVGTVTCLSAEEGITCTGDDGHGFFVSRAAYRLFCPVPTGPGRVVGSVSP